MLRRSSSSLAPRYPRKPPVAEDWLWPTPASRRSASGQGKQTVATGRFWPQKRLPSPVQSAECICSETHVSMVTFEGFVESTSLVGDQLQMRLMVGGFDPSPTEAPVLKVTVEGLDTAQATYDELRRVLDADDGVYLSSPSAREVLLQSDHGHEIRLTGTAIRFDAGPFEARDFERLAKANHAWGTQLLGSLTRATHRNSAATDLVQQQAARIAIKLQGHEAGSTARTLYEQHMAFLNRLLAELRG